MKNSLSSLTQTITCTLILITSSAYAATVIDSPFGQFHCRGGSSACTMIDVYAANRFLAQNPRDWKLYTPVQLTTLVRCGIERYAEALANIQETLPNRTLPIDILQFQACGAAPYVSKLVQLDVFDVAPFASDEFEALQATGMPVITKDALPGTISQYATPACGVWTNSRGYSYLVCSKDDTWLFFDSHYQSNGSAGTSLRVFNNVVEFRKFLNTNKAFELEPDETANFTLFAKIEAGE